MNFEVSKLLIKTVVSGFVEEASDIDFGKSTAKKCAIFSTKHKLFRDMWFF